MNLPEISITDFNYILPEERIAKYPLEQRDHSKLLINNKGELSQDHFYNLPSYLPSDSIMFFNNTKVVPARLIFRKPTGAFIEIFCLEPVDPAEYNISFAQTKSCVWKCIIGNAKRWKSGLIPIYIADDDPTENPHNELKNEIKQLNFRAELVSKFDNTYYVRFHWDMNLPFSKVLETVGRIPIPPYLNRETEAIDYDRYQTTYAERRGSVAAPTAGLHFTPKVLEELKKKGIDEEKLCLHVGAGTFLPVKNKFIAQHIMHSEPFSVTLEVLERIYNKPDHTKIISVGTTSTRSLESLYYLGIQCIKESVEKWEPKCVNQWAPYQGDDTYSTKEAIGALISYMKFHNLQSCMFRTQIIIVPSYKYRIVDILITNFHQPQSTLLLLVSAFLGKDNKWENMYKYALDNDFRFLSYGDSCLLMP